MTLDRRWVGELASALLPTENATKPGELHDAFSFALPHEHVNCSEYRAKRVAVRRKLRAGVCNARILVASDSNVTIGASTKGRSKSKKLMRLQREEIAECLFANVYTGLLPIDTHDNPADEPSRSRPLRSKSSEFVPPKWVRQFLGGNVQAIDRVVDPDIRSELLFKSGQTPNPAVDRAAEWKLPSWKFSTQRRADSLLAEPAVR